LARVRDYIVGPSVLEIGCAFGDGYEYVPEGTDYEGVDLDCDDLEFAKHVWPEMAGPGRTFYHADFRD